MEFFQFCPFFQIVKNNQNNRIPSNELKNTLDLLGYQLPNHEVRELVNSLKNEGKLNESEGISKELLKEVCFCLFLCLHFSTRALNAVFSTNQRLPSARFRKSKQKLEQTSKFGKKARNLS